VWQIDFLDAYCSICFIFVWLYFAKILFIKMDFIKHTLVSFCIKNNIKSMIMQSLEGEIWNLIIIEKTNNVVEFQLYRQGNMASNELIKL
jgi:hypothetical protein